MSLGYPSVHVSTRTRQKHWQFDEKKAPIPQLIWSDGHAEWSRWYWFKEIYEHIGRSRYIFK